MHKLICFSVVFLLNTLCWRLLCEKHSDVNTKTVLQTASQNFKYKYYFINKQAMSQSNIAQKIMS